MAKKLVTEEMRKEWLPVLSEESKQIQPLSAENVAVRLLQTRLSGTPKTWANLKPLAL